jgi:hypothetical protein
MAKLESVEALGSYRPQSNAQPILNASNTRTQAKGELAVADVLGDVGASINKKEDTEAQTELSYAKSNFLRAQLATENELEKDPDFTTYQQRYTKNLTQSRDLIAKGLKNERARELFLADSDMDMVRGEARVLNLANTKQKDDGRAKLLQLQDMNRDTILRTSDNDMTAQLMAATEAAINSAVAQGYLTQEEAAKQRIDFSRETAKAKFDTRPPQERLAIAVSQAVRDYVPRAAAAFAGGADVAKDAETLQRIAMLESSGNFNATNGRSVGLFQFQPATAEQYGLADRLDPKASAVAAARLMADNRAALSKSLGRDPSDWELYLAHQQGAAGAQRLIAGGDQPAIDVLAPAYNGDMAMAEQVIVQNGGSPDMTANQFASLWQQKFQSVQLPKARTEYDLLPYDTQRELVATAQKDIIAQQEQAKKQIKQTLDTTLSEAYDMLEENGFNAYRLPANVQAILKADPERKAWEQAVKYEGSTNPEAKQTLELMDTNELVNVDLNMYRADLSRGDFQTLQKRQNEARSPGGKATSEKIDGIIAYTFKTKLGIQELSNAGAANKMVKDKQARFKNQLIDQIEAYRAGKNGEWPDDRTLQTISDNLLMRVSREGGLFTGADYKLAPELTDTGEIPPGDLSIVEQSLADQGKIINEATVLRAYRLLQESRARKQELNTAIAADSKGQ